MPKAKRAASHGAKTVVYIHGILNKPPPSVLKCQWDRALFGVEMGDRTRMAYWVNREYYPKPLDETCAEGDRLPAPAAGDTGVRALRLGDTTAWLDAEIEGLTGEPAERRRLRALAERVLAPAPRAAGPRARSVEAKILLLPPFLRTWITRMLTSAFLKDVNDFLFREDRRQAMKATLSERLLADGGPYVVVAHSQGTMIAYDVLRELDPAQFQVPLFVTIGSPLGLDEVQDVFHQWIGKRGALPFPRCVGQWLNLSDDLDPVAADHRLGNDFSPSTSLRDEHRIGLNPDWEENPHSGTGYLRVAEVQRAVRESLEPGFASAVRPFVVARDLVGKMEDRPVDRHPALIQLALEDSARAAGAPSLEEAKRAVLVELRRLIPQEAREDAEIDEHLVRYVSASLTRREVEELSARCDQLRIEYVWRNATKRALLWMSAQRIQAIPAHVGYRALGDGIAWAVLDTGVNAEHPHFEQFRNIAEEWDCTGTGEPRQVTRDGRGRRRGRGAGRGKGAAYEPTDHNGHGTHVAAIIAGALREHLRLSSEGPPVALSGMAPQAKLHTYKVLDDQGEGRDSYIIKALDHVNQANEKAGRLVIHGVNLSLGGSFDPSVYGCGHSPLCAELRRLWRSGVIVCIAAGNEGYAVLQSAEGAIESNLDLSIGDPANLEEAIAVGSVHKENPHTYGVSYFSSRGPTADGRRKPDVVAPGERILSARHRPAATRLADGGPAEAFYVEMSGTSMATPHVSGILAAFLSVRRELIGYPEEVKRRLLESCTDLGRDPYIQGHGLPNLQRMLATS